MSTLLVAAGAFVGFIVAYHTYGRWLSKRIFNLDPRNVVPSEELRDDIDYIPTKKEVIFGHHFTSIAGTGPIVGPAIAVFWGWLPALLWVVFGSIFIGAVHDFGALVVSLRSRGQTVGEVAGRLISPRAKILFLIILAVALTIVLAIFGLVIATIFNIYPQSVLSVWIEIPLALFIGYRVYRRGGGLLLPSLAALAIMYGAIFVGVYVFQIRIATITEFFNPIVIWTLILFAYCFIASVLPVWTLLQPRDYINSHQLILALSLLGLGLLVAAGGGKADLASSAPAVAQEVPADAPPIWPFLFITIACGAVSGFHCLVSSGTSSKQLATELDAQYVGYGAMLLEGALAVIVILACCAGLGMGVTNADGQTITGRAAWLTYYQPTDSGWSSLGLGKKVGAFVEGGGNFLTAIGLPLQLGIGIMAVLVASFAATTLDTATRLQRYVFQELGSSFRIKPLTNKYVATGAALAIGAVVALFAGEGKGKGGLMLWPLFGATNQLLAGLAFMVTVFYLWRRSKPVAFAVAPMILMLILPAWAMTYSLVHDWIPNQKTLLIAFGFGILALQVWMVIEGLLILPRVRGKIEKPLPPLPPKEAVASGGGRSC